MKVCVMYKSLIFISNVMIWFSIGFLGLSMENGDSKGRLVFVQHIHTDCFSLLHYYIVKAGLEIKKIFRSPFGDQPENYSRQMQIWR